MLLKRVRNGEEDAFEVIFRRHYEPLLSYCRHMLGNQEEAEDALQQAFIRAHRALLKDSPPRELRPWLYAIARNRCLSAIAARRGRIGVESELGAETMALVGLSDQVREREDLREVVTDIARLPEDQRSALLLAELEDLSHQEVAGIVGCEVSKVKALVYQARSTLIADREARNASCQDIREELAVARGGQLRRGPLRRHLTHCMGCRSFQEAVNTQRGSLALVLPVLPSAGLAARILGHAAAGHTIAAAAQTGAALAPAGASVVAGPVATGGAGALAGGAGGSVLAAGAGVSGGATGGAMLGGGVLAKVAVGGALALLATAGAVTIPHHLEHSSAHAATGSRHHLPGAHVLASTGARARGLLPVADRTDIAQAPAGETQAQAVETPALNQTSSPDLLQVLPAAGLPPSPVAATPVTQTEQAPSGDPGSGGKGETRPVGQSGGGAHRHALLERKRRQLRIAHRRRQLRRLARLRRKRLAERRRLRAERRKHAREERERKARELKEAKEQRERLREERQRKARELKEAKERQELEALHRREAREAAQGKQTAPPPAATAPTSTSTTTVTSTSTATSAPTKPRLKRKTTSTVTTTSTSAGN
jgi:RNA polymerase sigma factor (sigma-70 family)